MLVLPAFVFAGQPPECPPADTVVRHITVVDTVVVHDTLYVDKVDQAYADEPMFDTYTGSSWGGGFKVTQPLFTPVDSTTTIDERWKRQAEINQKVAIGLSIVLIGTIVFCLLSKTKVTTNIEKGTQCEDCP